MIRTAKKWVAAFLVAASALVVNPEPVQAITVQDYFALENNERGIFLVDYLYRMRDALNSPLDSKGQPKSEQSRASGLEMARLMDTTFFSKDKEVQTKAYSDLIDRILLSKDGAPDHQVEKIAASYVMEQYKVWKAAQQQQKQPKVVASQSASATPR